MNDVVFLLFEKKYGPGPLFRNQVDLALQLLNHPKSELYIAGDDKDAFTKRLTNVKAYISQLLSSTVNRNITEEFRRSLELLIAERLERTDYNPHIVSEEILRELNKRNSNPTKQEITDQKREQIKYDIEEAKYISIITSRPLEITREYQNRTSSFSFQPYLLEDLVETFSGKSSKLKSYRFNFPMTSFGEIFWKGLRRFVRFYLNKNYTSVRLQQVLQKQFGLNRLSHMAVSENPEKLNELLDSITDQILVGINQNKYILVFITEAPIYNIPIIAIDPDSTKQAKVYALFDEGDDGISAYKYSREDYTLWRLFFWDKIKTIKSSCLFYKDLQQKWNDNILH